MRFSEKLDLLMNITKTSNSALAHAVRLDASYISRLRSGKRLMPRDKGVVQSMAACFARRCAEGYQKKAVKDTLGLPRFPEDGFRLTEEISGWLLKQEKTGTQKVEHFLKDLTDMESRKVPAAVPPVRGADAALPAPPREGVSAYYGIDGKRRAVEAFLSQVAAAQQPQTLLLFSDEETSWMTDPAFARKWASLMADVLAKGNKIKIIHTISRDLDEMLSAISQWMPLYMTGSIEPYFYPKKRDGIFRTTLFIAPETAAVVSGSIGEQISRAANLLFFEKEAVASFAEEFTQYLRMCRPLMRIFTTRDQEACFATIEEFEQEQADTLIKTESLSLLTMPEELLRKILLRNDLDARDVLKIHHDRQYGFQKMTEESLYTEIIALPDARTVKSGGVKVAMSAILNGGAVYYAPDEYVRHLEHVVELLETRDNFRVHLIQNPAEDRYMVYAREELGVIVAKTSQPPVVLAMNESNMTAAFWDFLRSLVGDRAYRRSDKRAVVSRLREFLRQLRELLSAG